MRPLYLDTAVLVATLVHEPGTAVAHRFLQDASDLPWLISPWVDTELASALAQQRRRGVIDAHERDWAWHRFQELRERRLQVQELAAADFDVAARFCLADAPPLRAGDALHIALCLRLKSCLVSFDQAMCAAAAHHRVAIELLQMGQNNG